MTNSIASSSTSSNAFWSRRNIAAYLVMFAFTIMSTAHLEVTQITVKHFDKPFILRYINNIELLSFMIVIPFWKYYRTTHTLSTNIFRTATQPNIRSIVKHSHTHSAADHAQQLYHPLKWFFIYGSVASILQTCSGIMVNIASQGTTVPTSNAIAGMKPVFVLILSAIVLHDTITFWKISAVLMALFGISFFVFEVLFGDNHHKHGSTQDTFWGIILTMCWNLGFACRDIISKKVYLYCYVEDKIVIGSMTYVVSQAAWSLPFFVWSLFWPQEWHISRMTTLQWQLVLAEGLVIFTLQSLICIAISIKSPFYTTIGGLCAMPLSFVVDMFVHNYVPNVYAISGAACLVGAFLMLEILKPKEGNCCKRFVWCNRAIVNAEFHLEGENENGSSSNNVVAGDKQEQLFVQSSEDKEIDAIIGGGVSTKTTQNADDRIVRMDGSGYNLVRDVSTGMVAAVSPEYN